ncbi:MAG TPA: S-layer homology domain-containing protein [Clostridiales bacterium]|nr:S-layer homology domain-containing protein [Clostridiales bacterium]
MMRRFLMVRMAFMLFTSTVAIALLTSVIFLSGSITVLAEMPTSGSGFSTVLERLSAIENPDIEEAAKRFNDIKDHWSKEYIGKLALLEIVAGYGGSRFGPEDTLKVDEFLKMTLRAMGHKVEEGMEYWAEPYIKLAREEKIIEEKEFTDYRRPILREEAARIMVKTALKIEEAPIPNHTSYAKLRIPDYHDIGDEYKQHVLYAYSMGFIAGIGNGSFLPKKTLTRGEGSAIVMRYLDEGMRKPMKPKDSEIVKFYDDYENKIYEIYPPSKTEVIDVIRVMSDSAKKSKGLPLRGYYAPDEVVGTRLYKSKEAYEESSIFKDCSFSIRMAEWELNGYDITIFDAKATKELHRDVFIDLLNHLLEDEAERAIKDFDHILELAIKRQGIPYQKEYSLNNRIVIITKHNSDDGFGMYIRIKNKGN